MKPGIWGQVYLTAYHGALRDKLTNDEELTKADRSYLAEMLAPKEKPKKRPEGRPKGSTKTEARNLHLCHEYLDLYNEHGDSDAAFKYLSARYKEREAAHYDKKGLTDDEIIIRIESLIRKVVGGTLLQHAKVLNPFILREGEKN